ncbi:RpoE-regulated lipoprotein [Erwinia sp. P6884]|uniref:RpoE-regulated lipoprotein n=1 Tax=Erwinia sp. P6884 TaxID=3141450 RepID=UPI00318F83AB
MKTVRPALIAAALLLTGCASSGSAPEPDSGVTWWNPLTYSWSSLSPLRWFDASLTVTESGVGDVNGSTAMNLEAVSNGLKGEYRLRKGMRGQNGEVVSFFQAMNDGQVKMEITGDATVSRIDVMDDQVEADGNKIGTAFSELYSKAYGACRKGTGSDSEGLECKAPGSQHISYLFSGEWHGPEGLIPPDDTLKSWTISKIIWRR